MGDEPKPPKPKLPSDYARPKTFEEMSPWEREIYSPRQSRRKRKFDIVYDEPGDADVNGEVDDD